MSCGCRAFQRVGFFRCQADEEFSRDRKPHTQAEWRHAKLDPHRRFLIARIEEKADITMPELAAELSKATGTKADPASLSRWLIRNGYRFKKNAAGERARSPRCQSGARGMDRPTPAANAA
jgi:transposase